MKSRLLRNGASFGVWIVAVMALALMLITAFGDGTNVPSGPPDAAAVTANAAAPSPDALSDMAAALCGKYSWATQVLVWLGVIRLIMKPTMTFIRAVVAATPTTADDHVVDVVEASTAWRWFCWVLDWAFSLKVGTQKKQ